MTPDPVTPLYRAEAWRCELLVTPKGLTIVGRGLFDRGSRYIPSHEITQVTTTRSLTGGGTLTLHLRHQDSAGPSFPFNRRQAPAVHRLAAALEQAISAAPPLRGPNGADSAGRPREEASDAGQDDMRPTPSAAAITDWPDARGPAEYLGADPVREWGVVTRWRTPSGVLAVVWPFTGITASRRAQLFAAAADTADATVMLRPDWGIHGPALERWDPAADGAPGKRHEVSWRELTRVLGQPAPYWPTAPRIPALMNAWTPGSPQITSPVVCDDPDIAPLLRLAATADDATPLCRTLLHLARVIQCKATESAHTELGMFGQVDAGSYTLPVAPAPVPEVDVDDLDASTQRAGWLDVLGRSDPVAAACVRTAVMWDGGSHFPFGDPELVDPTKPPATEWARRLVPVARTAMHVALDPDGADEPLVDPLTDAPVTRALAGVNRGQMTVAVPQRLPASAPLAELILGHDETVWVRTDDGVLWPAPKNEYYGLNWGYPGSGPGTLALLIARLLDDITAPGADDVNGAPPGLEKLTTTDWPGGTVFTRAQLEAARDDTTDPQD